MENNKTTGKWRRTESNGCICRESCEMAEGMLSSSCNKMVLKKRLEELDQSLWQVFPGLRAFWWKALDSDGCLPVRECCDLVHAYRVPCRVKRYPNKP